MLVSCVPMEIPIQERADMTLEIHKGETENQAFFFHISLYGTPILS